MRLGRAAGLVAVVLLLAGCGSEREGHGTARLWITRDRGAHVLLTTTVPAGLTAMQALRSKAKVETRYGGRYVQAIEGVEGSLSARRDWFYFVNGIESDRGAAEYRLHPGDLEWWDFRSWRKRMGEPIVVGAFPEPFLHGFGGNTHPTLVRYAMPAWAPLARRLGRLVRASRSAPRPRNEIELVAGAALRATLDRRTLTVRFTIGVVAARRLVANPAAARFRYEGLP